MKSLRLSSAENQHCCSISECSHPAFDGHIDNTSEVESPHSRSAGDSKTGYSHPISQVGKGHAPEETPSAASFLRSLSASCSRVQADFHDDDDDVASTSQTQFDS